MTGAAPALGWWSLQPDGRVPERGLLAVSDEVWALAVRRAEVIAPLAEAGRVGGEAAAEQLGVSR